MDAHIQTAAVPIAVTDSYAHIQTAAVPIAVTDSDATVRNPKPWILVGSAHDACLPWLEPADAPAPFCHATGFQLMRTCLMATS
jgi:hypothetical protein